MGASAAQQAGTRSVKLRRETTEVKAERLAAQELDGLGWDQSELAGRRKSDPGKLAIAARLRNETTLSLKEVAARVHLGTSKSANAQLHDWMRQPADSAQGQFQI